MRVYQNGTTGLTHEEIEAVRKTDPGLNDPAVAAAIWAAKTEAEAERAAYNRSGYEEEEHLVSANKRLTRDRAVGDRAVSGRPQYEYFTVPARLCPSAAVRTGNFVPFGFYPPNHSETSTRSHHGEYAVVVRSRESGGLWVWGSHGHWQPSRDRELGKRLSGSNSTGQVSAQAQRPPVLYTIPHESLAEARMFDGPFDPYGRYETGRSGTQSSRRTGSYAVAAVDYRGTWVLNDGGWELLRLGDDRLVRLEEQLQRHQDLVGRVDRDNPGNVSETVRGHMLGETLERLWEHAQTANGPTLRFVLRDGNPQIATMQLAADLERRDLRGRRSDFVVARVSCQGKDKTDPIKAAIDELFRKTENATVESWQEKHPRSYFARVEKLNYRLVDCAAVFLKLAGSVRVTDGHTLGAHVVVGTSRLARAIASVRIIIPPFQFEAVRQQPIAPGEIPTWAGKLRAALATVNRKGIVPVMLIEGSLTEEQMVLLSDLTRAATNNPPGPRLRLQVVLVDGAGTRQPVGHHDRIRTVEFAHLTLEQVRADVQACADLHQIELRDGALEALADCVSQVATTRDNVTITAERIGTEPIYLWRGELLTFEELKGRLPLCVGGPVSVATAIDPSRANYVVVNAIRAKGLSEQLHPLQVQEGNVTLNGQVVAGFSFDADGVLREFGNLGAERQMLSWLGDMSDRKLSPRDVAYGWSQYVASHGSAPCQPQAWVRPTVGTTAPVATKTVVRTTQVVFNPTVKGLQGHRVATHTARHVATDMFSTSAWPVQEKVVA